MDIETTVHAEGVTMMEYDRSQKLKLISQTPSVDVAMENVNHEMALASKDECIDF